MPIVGLGIKLQFLPEMAQSHTGPAAWFPPRQPFNTQLPSLGGATAVEAVERWRRAVVRAAQALALVLRRCVRVSACRVPVRRYVRDEVIADIRRAGLQDSMRLPRVQYDAAPKHLLASDQSHAASPAHR